MHIDSVASIFGMNTLKVLSVFCVLMKYGESLSVYRPIYPIYPIKPIHPIRCPPVCAISCKYGNIPDKNGCPTCRCRPARCLLPKKVGPCRAAIPRYFFNKKTKRCQKFIWGGCKPNKNNFKTLYECQRICGYSKRKFIKRPYPYPPVMHAY